MSSVRFVSLAWSKLILCSTNHRPCYWSNLPCDWPSSAWAYSEQETENRPRSMYQGVPIEVLLVPNQRVAAYGSDCCFMPAMHRCIRTIGHERVLLQASDPDEATIAVAMARPIMARPIQIHLPKGDLYTTYQLTPTRSNWVMHHNTPISQIPQCIRHVSHSVQKYVHMSVTKWGIVGYGTGALWNLCNRSMAGKQFVRHHIIILQIISLPTQMFLQKILLNWSILLVSCSTIHRHSNMWMRQRNVRLFSVIDRYITFHPVKQPYCGM